MHLFPHPQALGVRLQTVVVEVPRSTHVSEVLLATVAHRATTAAQLMGTAALDASHSSETVLLEQTLSLPTDSAVLTAKPAKDRHMETAVDQVATVGAQTVTAVQVVNQLLALAPAPVSVVFQPMESAEQMEWFAKDLRTVIAAHPVVSVATQQLSVAQGAKLGLDPVPEPAA